MYNYCKLWDYYYTIVELCSYEETVTKDARQWYWPTNITIRDPSRQRTRRTARKSHVWSLVWCNVISCFLSLSRALFFILIWSPIILLHFVIICIISYDCTAHNDLDLLYCLPYISILPIAHKITTVADKVMKLVMAITSWEKKLWIPQGTCVLNSRLSASGLSVKSCQRHVSRV